MCNCSNNRGDGMKFLCLNIDDGIYVNSNAVTLIEVIRAPDGYYFVQVSFGVKLKLMSPIIKELGSLDSAKTLQGDIAAMLQLEDTGAVEDILNDWIDQSFKCISCGGENDNRDDICVECM